MSVGPIRSALLWFPLGVMCAVAAAGPLAAQPPAAPSAPAVAAAPDAAAATPPEKIYIVGYAVVILMIALGVLVVCQVRPRADRPSLPQEELAERLRSKYGTGPRQRE